MEKTQVQKEFEAFSAVPRCSYHNENAIAYVISQAEQLGLEYVHDKENGNVVIKKPAAAGKRDRSPLLLQGHLDMVPQVKPGLTHDFTKDPLDLKIDGDSYYAEGTTLGADDGVAMALIFALLKEPDLKNPPIEALFTTDEEVGMKSVKNADFHYLRAKYLINLDHCEEGKLIIGCCGGVYVDLRLPVEKESCQGSYYEVVISGLKGGHSGIEINKERANAVKLMAHFLYWLSKEIDFKLVHFTADGKDNAISNRASAGFVADASETQKIKKAVREVQRKFRHIFRLTDPKIKVEVQETKDYSTDAFTKSSADKLLSLLIQLPYGVIKREQYDFSKPETSANIGVVKTEGDEASLVYSIRSSVEERANMIVNRTENLAALVGASISVRKEYPAWLPDEHSPLIAPFKTVFKELYGHEPLVDSVHAGLECGYLLEKSNIDAAISVGADVVFEHTTEERLSISSLNRTYEYLKTVIERI